MIDIDTAIIICSGVFVHLNFVNEELDLQVDIGDTARGCL